MPQDKEQFCMDLLKQYDMESYLLVNRYSSSYKGIFNSYLSGKDVYNILYSLPIAVHEMTHLYNNTSMIKTQEMPMSIPGFSGIPLFTKSVTRRIPSAFEVEEYNEILNNTNSAGDKNFLNTVYKNNSRLNKFELTNAYKGQISKLVMILEKAGYYKDQDQASEEKEVPQGEMKYYISNSEEHKVKMTKIFLTKEIAKTIPAELSNYEYSRYDVYINSPSTTLTAQGKGIYGLMDEWCAFYNGSRTAVKMLPYFKEKLPQNENTWRWYFKTTNWHYWSYYDMKYYIYKYLLFAKDNYPDTYRAIKSNDNFIQTFKELDNKWLALMSEFTEVINETYGYLTSMGYKVIEGERITTIRKDGKSLGLLNFNFIVKKLKTELGKNIYQDLL